jgi:hypothetical protein
MGNLLMRHPAEKQRTYTDVISFVAASAQRMKQALKGKLCSTFST